MEGGTTWRDCLKIEKKFHLCAFMISALWEQWSGEPQVFLRSREFYGEGWSESHFGGSNIQLRWRFDEVRFYCLVRWLYSGICVSLTADYVESCVFVAFFILHTLAAGLAYTIAHTSAHTRANQALIGDIWSRQTCHSLRAALWWD